MVARFEKRPEMRVLCSIHGPQGGVLVSPDLKVQRHPVVCIAYEFDGELADRFLVSATFALQHRLTSGVVPMPKSLNKWVALLVPWCRECFVELHGGGFKNNDWSSVV